MLLAVDNRHNNAYLEFKIAYARISNNFLLEPATDGSAGP
jgi:hypothetical protein